MITGKPCVDFLDNWNFWKEGYSISMVLLAVQVTISYKLLSTQPHFTWRCMNSLLKRESKESLCQIVFHCTLCAVLTGFKCDKIYFKMADLMNFQDITSWFIFTIQTLLCKPVLDNAVNMEAVTLIKHSPHTYHQMVLDCVAASQRVEGKIRKIKSHLLY